MQSEKLKFGVMYLSRCGIIDILVAAGNHKDRRVPARLIHSAFTPLTCRFSVEPINISPSPRLVTVTSTPIWSRGISPLTLLRTYYEMELLVSIVQFHLNSLQSALHSYVTTETQPKLAWKACNPSERL